jgi:hypothetical protein
MTRHHRSGASGASSAIALDRSAPSSAVGAPMVTVAIPVGSASGAVAVSPLTGVVYAVYVANVGDGTVSVISG